MIHPANRRGKQKGFTLVEMLITIIIIGIVAAIIYPLINNSITAKSNAQKMMTVSQNVVRSIALMNQTMRSPTTVTSNPLTASGNTMLDAVIMGDKVDGIISPTYAPRYLTSGIRNMSDAVIVSTQPSAGSPGVYMIGDSVVSLVNINSRQIGVQLTNVPTDMVQEIFQSREGGIKFDPATARNTGVVRFAAVSGTTHPTLTLVYDL